MRRTIQLIAAVAVACKTAFSAAVETNDLAQATAPETLLFERSPAQRVLVVAGGDYAEFRSATQGIEDALQAEAPHLQVDFLKFPSAEPPKYWVRAQLKQPPAVIVAVGTRAAILFRQAAPDTPLVFTMVYNPQLSGLVPTSATSATNVTGVSLNVPLEKRIEMLRTVLPQAKRVGIIYNPEETGRVVMQLRTVANAMGINIISRAVASDKDVRDAAAGLWWQIDALWLTADSAVLTPQTFHYLIQESLRQRVPIVGLSPSHVKAGALMSVGASDFHDIGVQTAKLVLEVLGKKRDGAPIPVQSPRKIGLYLNLRAATLMGIPVSPETAASAVERYE